MEDLIIISESNIGSDEPSMRGSTRDERNGVLSASFFATIKEIFQPKRRDR
ncbi:hypothetical protein [Cohnella zeiphila]|uniref:Uncharacterized protein n=1 Tax=Cohnella zeiphila TaxID=2761120 RepID=A0A7X0SG53_9BACL|nr:hypothetical protein [Cohnella zeiphila]MBB6729302.1 hypothetical protein [Cohnella zeiphila]